MENLNIIIEQIICRMWNSTGLEAILITKSRVGYLIHYFKGFLFKTFPEYDSLSILKADNKTIYDSLKLLAEKVHIGLKIDSHYR